MPDSYVITITVKLFAIYRERVGVGQIILQLPLSSTVGDVLAELNGKHPELTPLIDHTFVALNQEYVTSSDKVEDGDEIAIIPPVSGG
ncbi:molybdopterin converting factor subunit 1 [SAR202 cluster bacterium AD-802-E10_MRT_200m]|nr:molybdopterin converting factor subunit 1 [SAR202 cluster bacterium AD-802-E10_MRT_200m]